MLNLEEKTRAWLYRIATAAIGLLVVLGLLTEIVATEILLLVAAILGLGEGLLATANTSTKSGSNDG